MHVRPAAFPGPRCRSQAAGYACCSAATGRRSRKMTVGGCWIRGRKIERDRETNVSPVTQYPSPKSVFLNDLQALQHVHGLGKLEVLVRAEFNGLSRFLAIIALRLAAGLRRRFGHRGPGFLVLVID